MGFKRWDEIKHKASPEKREKNKREALEELDRTGYAAVRRARELTQVELAERLGVSQSNIAAMEARTELQLGTLAKYIRALGGELEIRAVFPDAIFNLDPPPPPEMPAKAPRSVKIKASAAPPRKRAAAVAG